MQEYGPREIDVQWEIGSVYAPMSKLSAVVEAKK